MNSSDAIKDHYLVSKNVYFKSSACFVRNEVPTQISLILDVPANLQVAIIPEKESPPPYGDATLEYLKWALRYIGYRKINIYILINEHPFI